MAVYLATLSHNKALVNLSAGDPPGALAAYDSGIQIFERLVNREGWRELANFLATCYTSKAIAVTALGDNREAVASATVRSRSGSGWSTRRGGGNWRMISPRATRQRPLPSMRAATTAQAIALYDRAIEIHQRLSDGRGGGN